MNNDVKTVDADSVFVVVNKNYRVSRNIRANWYFQKLHSTFTLNCTDNQPLLCNSSTDSTSSEDEEGKKREIHQTNSKIQNKDFEIISATPRPGENSDVIYKITEKTDVRFLSLFYRFVFIIDMSPSMFGINGCSTTLVNIALAALEKSLKKISHINILPGTKFAYFPKIIVTILAHSNENAGVLLQGWEVNNCDIPNFMKLVRENARKFETELYNGSQIGFKEHLPASEGILLNMIRHGVLALSSLHPDNSTAGIIIISDCVLSMSDMIQLDRTLGMLRTRAIACSFVKVGKLKNEDPFEYFGHIDYADMCRFIAAASFGSFILMNDNDDEKNGDFNFNTVNGVLLARSFNKSFISVHDNYHLGSPIIILEYFKKSVNAPLMSVLSVRLREGYIVRSFHIENSANQEHIIVDLILIWKPGVLFHYSMMSAWPLSSHNHTEILVKIEGNYEFIHEVTCIRKSIVNSDYRMKLIHRFRFHFQQLEQTDLFLVHLHSFNINALYYHIPESHKNGLKAVFILSPDLSDIVVCEKSIEQFAAYWKPIVQLDISNCQKWLHTHSINVILEHDSPIPPNINLSEPPNSKLSNIVCRQAQVQLSNLLRQSCSFILLENHSYVKFIYDEEKIDDLVPLYFYLIRLELKIPEVRIKLAFLAGTPGELRYSICHDLKEKIANLTFPARGRQADPKSRHKSGHFVKGSCTHLPPLQRTWSETQCCNIIESAIDRLLVTFIPRASLNLKTLELQTCSDNLSLPMRLLVHQLQHERCVWIVQQPSSFKLERLTLSKMFNSLINIRLQEGFHFAYCKDGFVNMVQEITFSAEGGNTYPALVQYILYPLSQKPRQDSDCSDVGMETDVDDISIMTGIQVVSEVWISPVLGSVQNPQEEITHWKDCESGDIPKFIFDCDLDCLTTYITFERLKMTAPSFGMFTNKRIVSNKNINVLFPNLNLLLSKSPQLMLFFKFYEPSESEENTDICNNKLMSLLFGELLTSRYAELDLNANDSIEFIQQQYTRLDKILPPDREVNLTMRCFIWIDKDSNSIVVLVAPSNYSHCTSDVMKDIMKTYSTNNALPIFVYVFSRGYLSFLLEDRWTYQQPADDVLNLDSFNSPVSDSLMLDSFISSGKKNQKFTEELRAMQSLFVKHTRGVNSIFSKSFVTGVYDCLRENHSLCKSDIEMTLNTLCEELAPLEIDATQFMQTVCGHCFRPLQKLKYNWLLEGENPLLSWGNESDPDICKIQVKSIREIDCEVQAGFHERVKRRIDQFISKYFHKVRDLHEYLIYSPAERETKNIEQNQFMRSRNASELNSDVEQSNQFQYYRQCSKEDQDDYRSMMPFDEDEFDDIDNDADTRNHHLPFFLHFTCSVTYKDKREFVSLKEIPTCLEALAPTILSVVALSEGHTESACGDDYMPRLTFIDLRDLKFTFDLNPLTYISADNDPLDSDMEEHSATNHSHHDTEDCKSDTANADTLQFSGRSTPSGESNNDSATQTSRTQGAYRSCKLLLPQQRSVLFKCRDELLWTLKDEVVCALKYLPPVVESSIHTVVNHIDDVVTHNLDEEMCVGIHRRRLDLEFVYGPDKSRYNFIERFEKMPISHSQCKLKKTGDYYYFIREPCSRTEWEKITGSESKLFPNVNDWDDRRHINEMNYDESLKSALKKFSYESNAVDSVGNDGALHRCSSDSELPVREQAFVKPYHYVKRNSGNCDKILSEFEKIHYRSSSFQAISNFLSSSPLQAKSWNGKGDKQLLGAVDNYFNTSIDQTIFPIDQTESPSAINSSEALPDINVSAPCRRQGNNSGGKKSSLDASCHFNITQEISSPRRHRSGESSSIAFFNRSRTPQPGDCLSRTSSRGYEGDNSSGGEFADILSEFNEESLLGSTSEMPPYWLLMKMCDSSFYIYFHHTDSHTHTDKVADERILLGDNTDEEDSEMDLIDLLNNEDCVYCKLFCKVIVDIRSIVKTVNQSMLLQNMSDTRLCSPLLVPEDESDMQWTLNHHRLNKFYNNNDNNYEDEEDKPSKLYDEMKFSAGTFACPVKKKMYFQLHHRLKTHSEQGRKAIPTIRSVLENITVTNRKNMFFVVDTNGSQGVFYISLFEKSMSVKELTDFTEESGGLEVFGAASILEKINLSGSGADDSASKDQTVSGAASSDCPAVDLLEVLVHGIEHPSEHINNSIWSTMGQKLDLVVLKHLSDNLHRNPMTRLTKEDVEFLQSADHSHLPKAPKESFYVTLPSLAVDNMLPFCWYLKQNMLLNFISPKFNNSVPCSKFGLSCDTAGEIFLFNRTTQHGISNNGIASIVVQLVGMEENEAITILGFTFPHFMAGEKMTRTDFHQMTEVTEYKVLDESVNSSTNLTSPATPDSTTSACKLRFQIWERGHTDLSALCQRILNYVKQSVKDVLMEYRLLTMPVCDLPWESLRPRTQHQHAESSPSAPVIMRDGSAVSGGEDMELVALNSPTVNSTNHLSPGNNVITNRPYSSPSIHNLTPLVGRESDRLSDSHLQTRPVVTRQCATPTLSSTEPIHPSSAAMHYESGVKGSLHSFYTGVMLSWLKESCASEEMPLYTKKEYSVQFNLNVHYLIRDLVKVMQDHQIIDFNVFSRDGDSNLQQSTDEDHPWLPYPIDIEAEDEAIGKTNPGLKRNFVLIGRNYDQWCHFLGGRRHLNSQSMTQVNLDFHSQSNTTPNNQSPKHSNNLSTSVSNVSLPNVGVSRSHACIDSRRIRSNQRQLPFEGSNATQPHSYEPNSNLVQYSLSSLSDGYLCHCCPHNTMTAGLSASNSSFSHSGVNPLPDFCRISKHLNTDAVVARQTFAMVYIEDQNINTYCYNWTKDALDHLEKLMSTLVRRQNIRFRMLRGMVRQKLGLFHTLMSKSWNYPEVYIRESCLSASPSFDNKQIRKTSAGYPATPRQAIWSTFKNVNDVSSLERKSSNDIIHHQAQQLLKTHEQENRRSKELYQLSTPINMWQTQSRVAVKAAFADSPKDQLESYNVIKRACRLLHTVACPLLFSEDLRNRLRFSMTHRGLTKPLDTVTDLGGESEYKFQNRRPSLSEAKLTKMRHNSGHNSRNQKSRSSSIENNPSSTRAHSEASKNRVGQNNASHQGNSASGNEKESNTRKENHSSFHLPTHQSNIHRNDSESSSSSFGNNKFNSHRVLMDEEWMPDITRYLIDQYALYLHELGFVLIPPPVANPAHPRGTYAVFRKCFQNNSGIIFLEVFFRGGFFCVRLAVIEAGRYNNRNPSTRSFFKQNLSFVHEACRVFDLTHVNSFMHDFHLSTIEKHLDGRTSIFKRRYHVVNFVEDFIKFSPRPPCYVRNHAYLTHFCVSRGNISQEILFKYLRERDKTYGLKVFRMSALNTSQEFVYDFCLFDQLSEGLFLLDEYGYPISPYTSYSAAKSSQLTNAYRTSFVLVKDSKSSEEDVLQFKFFVILTNCQTQQPLPNLEKISLELPQTYPAIRPCLLPTSDSDLSLTELQLQLDLLEEATDKISEQISIYTPTDSRENSYFPNRQNVVGLDLEDGTLSIEQCANLVNYMGEAVMHQKVTMQVLKTQIRHLKDRLIRLVTKAVDDCHKDMLWQRIYTTPNFVPPKNPTSSMADSSASATSPRKLTEDALNAVEFEQLFESTRRLDLSDLDSRLEVALDLVLPHFDQLINAIKLRSHNYATNPYVGANKTSFSTHKISPMSASANKPMESMSSTTFYCDKNKLISLVFFLPDYEDGFILITKRVANIPISDSASCDSSSVGSSNSHEVCKLFAIFRESSDLSDSELYDKFMNSPLVSLITDVIELCCYTVWNQLR